MSRAYHVVWIAESQTVTSSDELKMDVDLLDILPEDEMIALLQAALRKQGWKPDKDGTLKTTVEGLDVVLGKDGKSVTATRTASREVTGHAATTSAARDQAKRMAEGEKARLAKEVAKELMKKEPKLREQMQSALQKVYLEALERKARTLGEVESVQEHRAEDGSVEVVIKVKA